MAEFSRTGAARPREVIERFIRATADNAWDDLADLYAPDVAIEIPFAPPGIPRLAQGREMLRERFKGAAGMRSFERADLHALHETTDPEVVIAEWSVSGRAAATGREFTFTYIMVVRVRDGLIVSSRDYSDPIAGAQALDRLPQLWEALAGQAASGAGKEKQA